MTSEANEASTDLIRWTFTIDPSHRRAIESHLDDLGADVWVRDESKFQVTWEEPEESLDEVVEALWSIHGEPFEVTQEEFHRIGLHVLQHSEDEPARDAA
jgi:hypothetical protein